MERTYQSENTSKMLKESKFFPLETLASTADWALYDKLLAKYSLMDIWDLNDGGKKNSERVCISKKCRIADWMNSWSRGNRLCWFTKEYGACIPHHEMRRTKWEDGVEWRAEVEWRSGWWKDKQKSTHAHHPRALFGNQRRFRIWKRGSYPSSRHRV